MSKITITLETKDQVYWSDTTEMTTEEVQGVVLLCEKAVKGDVNMLSFSNGQEQYFFGKEIIKESIITIITS